MNIRFGNIELPFNDPPLPSRDEGNYSKENNDEFNLFFENEYIKTNQK